MTSHGYTRADVDHSVYVKIFPGNKFITLLLYVDDMMIASKCKVDIEEVKVLLEREFEMKNLGAASKILGM